MALASNQLLSKACCSITSLPSEMAKLMPLLSNALKLPGCTVMSFVNKGASGPRTILDSWTDVILPFSQLSDKERFKYANPHNPGMLRWGRLFEILDLCVGDVAYRHCDPLGYFHPDTKYAMVTASIDNIIVRQKGQKDRHNVPQFLKVNEDVGLRTFITSVGRTSMEIRAEVWQNKHPLSSGFFTMVLMDRELRSTPAPGIAHTKLLDSWPKECNKNSPFLPPSSESVLEIMSSAKRRALSRKMTITTLVDSTSDHPQIAISTKPCHYSSQQLPISEAPLPRLRPTTGSSYVTMSDTCISTAMLMQPDHQNVFGKMFGGYIARKAFETSWLCVQCFTRHCPRLSGVDDILFLKPVEIGDMIDFVATVVYSGSHEIQIQVDAWKIDPAKGTKEMSNQFHFYYDTVNEETDPPPKIMLKTDEELGLYLEAERRSAQRFSDHSQ